MLGKQIYLARHALGDDSAGLHRGCAELTGGGLFHWDWEEICKELDSGTYKNIVR